MTNCKQMTNGKKKTTFKNHSLLPQSINQSFALLLEPVTHYRTPVNMHDRVNK